MRRDVQEAMQQNSRALSDYLFEPADCLHHPALQARTQWTMTMGEHGDDFRRNLETAQSPAKATTPSTAVASASTIWALAARGPEHYRVKEHLREGWG